MLLGVDYYPEQWDPSLMDADLDRIRELGSNVIRIGEFAWHRMEREEGRYDFSFFDGVIAKAKTRGLSVIFGTPTAAPPAWLAARYPQILSQDAAGLPRSYGGRHVCCYNSAVYRRRCEALVTALARHYRDEAAITAWQVDNELGHEGSDLCWCPRCRAAFQDYLRERFQGDIQRLNAAWGTAFWGQEYNVFEEIPLPAPTIAAHSPALRLDWERFRSHSVVSFAARQAEILRREIPGAVVIHDFPGGGLGKRVDYAALAGCLDKAAYNNYPVWGGQSAPLPASEIAFGLDYIRGLKGQNFWITEAIMGDQGHDVTGFLPRPGQAGMWSWQSVARGCDGLLYFRYRGADKGAEQFCRGLLDADNIPRRRFYEAQAFFRAVGDWEDVLTAPVKSDVAILYDYDALASFRIQRQSALLDCEGEMKRLHRVFFQAGQMVDVIPAGADFSRYRLVLVPHMIITDEAFLRRLKDFVAKGGVAVATFRTAVKDRQNNLVFGRPLPVGCGDLLGLTVEETESVQTLDGIPLAGQGRRARAGIFRDMAAPTTAQVLYRYDDPFYHQYAAITRNRWGEGWAYYLGTAPDRDTLEEVLYSAMDEAGLDRLSLPEEVESVVREGGGRTVRFLINHNDHPVEALGERLEAFGVKVLPL